jgi:HSP20 family protein
MNDFFANPLSPLSLWDDLLGSFAPLGWLGSLAADRPGRFPRINAWEGDDALVLEAELPGIDPGQVEVGVEGATLTLKGKRPDRGADDPAADFERHLELPFVVDANAVKAVYRHGILTLTLPRAASAQRKAIAIETH